MINTIHTADILLPRQNIDLMRWSVVACDQFTAQPDYWAEVERLVGDSPSSLRVTLPEIWLSESETRIPAIQAAMRSYLDEGIWQTAVRDGMVLILRETSIGYRPGLLACFDLDQYDFTPGSASLIRPTEGTVVSRVPPRARIRRGALVELPHIMMLIDDPGETVIEPLVDQRAALRPLYGFELMQGGGRIQGWAVEGERAQDVLRNIEALNAASDGLLFAVGDGNHSLAAAKQCWLDIQKTLTPEERATHPARYAMAELVNLNCPALIFEPIHRALFHVDPERVLMEYRRYLEAHDAWEGEGEDLVALTGRGSWHYQSTQHPLRHLQAFLDDYMERHPEAAIDYIHGDDALERLVNRSEDTLGFMPRAFNKSELFEYIRQWGVLPRKTFSMGEAREKRYYLEARRILPE